ncbi:hypothetical protein SAMN02745135_02418 [Caloranaerobacter azorensis DSM 13643]|uniref:Uncharacterized protein n=1 Tax=Caloranaerobacter azorensis DSM 13643 TaxID=1121264 RepID=A0A1M5WDW3_9FIRM|nr:hypothetical protein [Caloranaerobacter azorensis]SHH85413.1 hypothetical protein SAMN02745135_02418 [Caloranaerobacter azorensis DSM 13643]
MSLRKLGGSYYYNSNADVLITVFELSSKTTDKNTTVCCIICELDDEDDGKVRSVTELDRNYK